MIRGLFTAASGMLAGERRQDVLANNLANANTIGYKKDDSLMRSFPEMLLYAVNDHTGSGPQGIRPGMPDVGAVGTGAFLEEILPRFTQGTLKPTNNKYGYAIIDVDRPLNPQAPDARRKTFFAVTDGSGSSFVTRDGEFHVNQQGFLMNAAGLFVQAVDDQGLPAANSRIKLNDTGTSLEAGTVEENGEFTVNEAYRFDAVDVLDTDRLQNAGNGGFRYDPANLGARTGEVRQGFLEGSNVDLTETMTDMIAVMRSYEANQRVIRTLDGTLDKAVNSLGRI
ncbi:flagellar hook-basal body protein [Effusibacillus consociatus]|uniref:Flagellar hook-basal body protein n=1 Tax=Effusibacillus consociatus TaxID=1117041 RepID=A0ABV9Q4T6_9BACL